MILRGARCQCSVCGEYFTRGRWFDRHRVGRDSDRRCLDKGEMEALGMVQRRVGTERLWSGPRMSLEALTARRQAAQAAEEVG